MRPLVEYSDDEDDDDDLPMSLEGGAGPNGEPWPSSDLVHPPGDQTTDDIAVFACDFIAPGTTVAQISPRAVLSCVNVFGYPTTQRGLPWRLGISRGSAHTHAVASGRGGERLVTTTHIGNTGESEARSHYDWLSGPGERSRGAEATVSYGVGLPANIAGISQQLYARLRAHSTGTDLAASLALSLALVIELSKGERSRWWGYLQSLPKIEPPLAIFWAIPEMDFVVEGETLGPGHEDDRREASERARKWIVGTQLERYLRKERIQAQIESMKSFYAEVFDPFLRDENFETLNGTDQQPRMHWDLFRRAFSLVSSRAFWVDAYHGLALVPIADAFNHAEENHVHLATDWEVCRICGALEACEHDDDQEGSRMAIDASTVDVDREPGSSSMPSSGIIQHSFDMVCERAVEAGSEVMNTYSAGVRNQDVNGRLGNVELLCRYGFVLEGNGGDRVSFGEEEVEAWAIASRDSGDLYEQHGNGRGATSLDEDGLEDVCARLREVGMLVEDESEPGHGEPREGGVGLEMDAEGRITTKLVQEIAGHARSLWGTGEWTRSMGLVQRVCSAVVWLCSGRLNSMTQCDGDEDERGGPEGEGSPSCSTSTGHGRLQTMVERYVRGERALLTAGVHLWKALGEETSLETEGGQGSSGGEDG